MTGAEARKRVRALVYGRVQGVGFRWFVRDRAVALRLAGWVRNLPDGSVEFEAEGPGGDVERLTQAVAEGHRHALVERIETTPLASRGGPRRFDIIT